jgi:hypothetical protein
MEERFVNNIEHNVAPTTESTANERPSLLQQLDWIECEVAKEPVNFDWLAAKSCVLYRLGRFGEALEAARSSLAQNAAWVEAHIFKCLSLYKLRRYDDFLSAFASWAKNGDGAYGSVNGLIRQLIQDAVNSQEPEFSADAQEVLVALIDCAVRRDALTFG